MARRIFGYHKIRRHFDWTAFHFVRYCERLELLRCDLWVYVRSTTLSIEMLFSFMNWGEVEAVIIN